MSSPKKPWGTGLPAVGTEVAIRHGRDNDEHLCVVTGYEVWPALREDVTGPFYHRVLVHVVYKGSAIANCRHLHELVPVGDHTVAKWDTGVPLTAVGRGERIGFAYLARHPQSGHLTGMVWDDPERVKLVAKDVAAWIKRGDHVARVERYKGDPMPTWHSDACEKPPAGWQCSRTKGHTGPCAAREKGGAP